MSKKPQPVFDAEGGFGDFGVMAGAYHSACHHPKVIVTLKPVNGYVTEDNRDYSIGPDS